MSRLIRPEELPRWVPGDVTLASEPLGWRNATMRGYRYDPLDVEVPAMQDFMLVAYCGGATHMARRFDGRWTDCELAPGDVSLLSRAEKSHWRWNKDIDVVHLYLPPDVVSKVATEVFDREIEEVRLRDVLKTSDPILHRAILEAAAEVRSQGLGGELYVDALASMISVHILRHYATVKVRDQEAGSGLPPQSARRVTDYVESHLDAALSLDELARLTGLSSWHFLRQFKRRFGQAPHAYVIQRRVERARALLGEGKLPIKEIASRCGFSDQAHMTRLFQRILGVTPRGYRESLRGR